MMVAPIEIRADFEANVYEVMYRHLPRGTFVDHDERVGPGVTASILPDGRVMGIELLGLQSDTLAAAERYATGQGLAFPDDLPAVLAARKRSQKARSPESNSAVRG